MKQGALIAAVVVALIGAGLLYLYKQRYEDEASGGEKIAVMVAASDLTLGDILESDKIAIRGIPATYIENRHIRDFSVQSVMGVRIRGRIKAGETILWSDLAISGRNSTNLSGNVLQRMRGISIPAGPGLTFDGLLTPGDRVDVLLTVSNTRSQRSMTCVLQQNLIVLAIGMQMGQPGESRGGKKQAMSTVTLAVKPTQGQILTDAMSQGKLTILLRNPDDVVLSGQMCGTKVEKIQ